MILYSERLQTAREKRQPGWGLSPTPQAGINPATDEMSVVLPVLAWCFILVYTVIDGPGHHRA